MKFEIDVLHAFAVTSGIELDGALIEDRKFVEPGRHVVVAERAFVEQLESAGYIEILSANEQTVVWSACCSDCEHGI